MRNGGFKVWRFSGNLQRGKGFLQPLRGHYPGNRGLDSNRRACKLGCAGGDYSEWRAPGSGRGSGTGNIDRRNGGICRSASQKGPEFLPGNDEAHGYDDGGSGECGRAERESCSSGFSYGTGKRVILSLEETSGKMNLSPVPGGVRFRPYRRCPVSL